MYSAHDLKHHVKKAHVSDDSGLKCNVCNGIFKNKLSLAEHSLKHQVKVVCEHCGDRLDESKIRMFWRCTMIQTPSSATTALLCVEVNLDLPGIWKGTYPENRNLTWNMKWWMILLSIKHLLVINKCMYFQVGNSSLSFKIVSDYKSDP